MSDYWIETMKYHPLDSLFPVDDSYDSVRWLESRHFIKKSSGAWEYKIHVGYARRPGCYFTEDHEDEVRLTVEASRENEYSNYQWVKSMWRVVVRVHTPSHLHLHVEDAESGRHTDVRDCLLEVTDFIEEKRKQLGKAVESFEETTA